MLIPSIREGHGEIDNVPSMEKCKIYLKAQIALISRDIGFVKTRAYILVGL